MSPPSRLSLWLPVIVSMAAIFVASGTPDPPIPSAVSDVSLHSAAYFVLTLLLIRATAKGSWRRVGFATLTLAWLIAVAYGASDEWHQSFVPTRHSDWRDVAADAIGACAAALVVGAWSIIRRL